MTSPRVQAEYVIDRADRPSSYLPNISDAKRDLMRRIGSLCGTHIITVVVKDGEPIAWTPMKSETSTA